MRNIRSLSRWSIFVLLILGCCCYGLAYEVYTTNGADNCFACHGDFRLSPYTSLKDGLSWGDDLHDVHRNTMLSGDCDTCHSSGPRSPVFLSSSVGGDGYPALSCTGCHGRTEDGTGTGTIGYGAGLRQHHFNAGESICVNCHTDADPANKTVVGEDVPPPYYPIPGAHVDAPTDPCNPNLVEEHYAASTLGLDNDGDLVYDMADSDCSGVAATPGESSGSTLLPLTVAAKDNVNGTLTLNFESGCGASDTNIEWGPLANLASYAYGTQSSSECGIGTTSGYVWTYPVSSDNIFFLIVGNDGVAEGSLGLDGAGTERPEGTGGICDVPQQLVDRCD